MIGKGVSGPNPAYGTRRSSVAHLAHSKIHLQGLVDQVISEVEEEF